MIITKGKRPKVSRRPPAGWIRSMEKRIKRKEPQYSKEQIDAIIGYIWYHRLPERMQRNISIKYRSKDAAAREAARERIGKEKGIHTKTK